MKNLRHWIAVPLLFILTSLLATTPLFAQTIVPPRSTGDPVPVEEPVEPMAVPAIVPDGSVHLELKDGSSLLGKLDVSKEIGLTMSVGKAKIPARKVISLEFDDKGNVRVRSLSGDIYSGAMDDDSLQIEVAWGNVEIPTKHISLVVSQAHVAQMQTKLIPIVQTGPDGRVTTTFAEQLTNGAGGYIGPGAASYQSGYGSYQPGSTAPPRWTPAPGIPAAHPPAIRVHGGRLE